MLPADMAPQTGCPYNPQRPSLGRIALESDPGDRNGFRKTAHYQKDCSGSVTVDGRGKRFPSPEFSRRKGMKMLSKLDGKTRYDSEMTVRQLSVLLAALDSLNYDVDTDHVIFWTENYVREFDLAMLYIEHCSILRPEFRDQGSTELSEAIRSSMTAPELLERWENSGMTL